MKFKVQVLGLFFISSILLSNAQNYKATEGTIKNLKGVESYNVVFKYSPFLKVPNFGSESRYLEKQVAKREQKEKGSGEKFKKEWFNNRKEHYEPKFIEGFNTFELKKKKVTIAEDSTHLKYTISVETHLIYPGYYLGVVLEHAKLEATIMIYETNKPSKILYASEIIHGEGKSGDNDLFRIATAYEDLGRWISKFIHRKT